MCLTDACSGRRMSGWLYGKAEPLTYPVCTYLPTCIHLPSYPSKVFRCVHCVPSTRGSHQYFAYGLFRLRRTHMHTSFPARSDPTGSLRLGFGMFARVDTRHASPASIAIFQRVSRDVPPKYRGDAFQPRWVA